MFILSSMGRPEKCREVAQSYAWDVPVILALWANDPTLRDYMAIQWPEGWSVEVVGCRYNGPTYNEILRRHPDEKCYGFLADDAFLEVPGMLAMLEEAAGDWNIAYANDKHHRDQIATMPCLGGELVRAVGYLGPPKLNHWAIDTAWTHLGRELEILRFFEQLTYDHRHPMFGKVERDATYSASELASMGWEQYLRQWMMDGEMEGAISRVRAAYLRQAA